MKRLIQLLLALVTISAAASPIPEFPFIAVQGKASSEVPPDNATITFTVLVHGTDSDSATKQVNDTLKQVTDAILAMAVPKGALTAADLGKRAVRERGNNYQDLKILGYDVSRDVKVKIEDLGRYTSVIQLIMKTDNITSVSSTFDTVKRNDVEAELVGKACADAKRKALQMSKGVGARLGSVFAVSDRDFTSLDERFGFGYPASTLGSGSVDDDVPIFVPAKIDIHAYVEVLYRLTQEQDSEQDGGGQPATRPESK
jgi:uncharacterized protein YggE